MNRSHFVSLVIPVLALFVPGLVDATPTPVMSSRPMIVTPPVRVTPPPAPSISRAVTTPVRTPPASITYPVQQPKAIAPHLRSASRTEPPEPEHVTTEFDPLVYDSTDIDEGEVSIVYGPWLIAMPSDEESDEQTEWTVLSSIRTISVISDGEVIEQCVEHGPARLYSDGSPAMGPPEHIEPSADCEQIYERAQSH